MKRTLFGTGSLLLFLAWTLLAVATLPDGKIWLLLAVVVLVMLLNDREGLRVLVRPRLLLFLLSIVALSPFILGEPDRAWGIIRLSREGLLLGFQMALRALTIMLAVNLVLKSVTVSELISLFERANLRGMGFALGVAFNMLNVLQDVVSDAYHTIRLRGGFRRPVANVRLMLITIITNALRYGDNIVHAALARAFDPAGRSTVSAGAHLPVGQLDRVLLFGLAAASAGLVFFQ